MGRRTTVPFTDEQRLKAFVLRARRITSHSLWREHRDLMEKMQSVQMAVTITHNHDTGERTFVHRQEFANEELFESLAARVRPLSLAGDQLHYKEVLKSIGNLVPADKFPDYVVSIDEWRALWDDVASRSGDVQAYSIVTDQGPVSDDDLTYAWLYGDVVHADDKELQAKGLDVEERYKAATGVISRMVDLTHATLLLVQALVDEGVLKLDSELFERQVVVTRTVFESPARVHRADAGTPLPTDLNDLDPDVWESVSVQAEEFLAKRSSCEVWKHKHGPRTQFHKITVQSSGPVTIETTP